MFQITAMVAKYVFPSLLLAFISLGLYLYLAKPAASVCRDFYAYQITFVVLFNLLSFILIFMKMWDTGKGDEGGWLDIDKIITMAIYLGEMLFMYILLCTLHRHTNRLLWNCVYMLLSISFLMIMRLNPQEARQQVYWIGIGFAICNLVMLIFRGRWIWKIPAFIFAIFSIGFIILPFVFPKSAGGALNWVSLRGISFQPSEIVKLTFAFFLAVVYTKTNRFMTVAKAGVMTVLLALVLLIQNDLGGLLILCILAWIMTYDYLDKAYVLWVGALLVGVAGFLAYHFVYHVRVRFDIWLDPWADINGSGYQIAQSLFAITAGGWMGMGYYQGSPGYIPVRTSDMIFSVICEEMGVVFAILMLLIYLLMFLFVLETGRREKNVFRRNLLIAFGVLQMTQTFIIVGGVIKLIPLTGVTMPFISYGGSSLTASFVTISIIEAVIRLYRIDREEARAREREREAQRLRQIERREQEIRQEQLRLRKYSQERALSEEELRYRQELTRQLRTQTRLRKQGEEVIGAFRFDDPF